MSPRPTHLCLGQLVSTTRREPRTRLPPWSSARARPKQRRPAPPLTILSYHTGRFLISDRRILHPRRIPSLGGSLSPPASLSWRVLVHRPSLSPGQRGNNTCGGFVMPTFSMAPRPPARDRPTEQPGGFKGTGRPHRATSRSSRAALLAQQVSGGHYTAVAPIAVSSSRNERCNAAFSIRGRNDYG